MLAPDRPSFDLRGHPPGSPLDTALWLLRHGLWPVPVRPAGKAPLGPGWGLRRPSPGGLAATYAGHPGAGVGVLLGPAGGVVDLEVDDPAAAAPLLARLFPGGPPPTAGWQSPRGRHWLFRWHPGLAGLPAVVHPPGCGLELRLGGPGKQVMSVCPPTPGPDGAARRWDRAGRVLPLPDAVLGWARENREPSGDRLPLPRRQAGTGPEAAFCRELARVREAPEGTRNRTLNRAAFVAGLLAGGGRLDPGAAGAALVAAAADGGLPAPEAADTVRRALAAGVRAAARTGC